MRQVSLFGWRIDAVTMDEATESLRGWIGSADGKCRYVVTPNVRHMLLLQRHEAFQRAHAAASLVPVDGVPILRVARMLGRRLPQRVAGADLVPALFERCRDRTLRVYLLGAAEGIADRAAMNIQQRWPWVQVVGTYSPPFGFENDPAENETILRLVADARPEVLILGFGAPKQEVWVHAHRDRLRARVVLCVGATIDFLAGHQRRAPRWIRSIGFEWLYRVAREPRRLGGRYLHDAWEFAWLVCQELL